MFFPVKTKKTQESKEKRWLEPESQQVDIVDRGSFVIKNTSMQEDRLMGMSSWEGCPFRHRYHTHIYDYII